MPGELLTPIVLWLPTLDNRTRPDHTEMSNYGAIPLDEKFIDGGYEMDRPGDRQRSSRADAFASLAAIIPHRFSAAGIFARCHRRQERPFALQKRLRGQTPWSLSTA